MVNVIGLPKQAFPPDAVIIGTGLTVTLALAESLHPLASVTVSVYVTSY